MLNPFPNSKPQLIIITNAGGAGVLTLDALKNTSLELTEIDSGLKQALQSFLPVASGLNNPIDILGDSPAKRYLQTIQAVLEYNRKDKKTNAILILLTPQVNTESLETAQGIVDLQEKYPQELLIPVFIGGDNLHAAIEIFRKNNQPYFDTPDEALGALKNYFHFQQKPKNLDFLIKKPTKKELQTTILQTKGGLNFKTLTSLAQDFNLPLAKFEYLTEQNLSDLWQKYGQNSVVKVVSANQLHRTEQKMVLVGPKTKNELKTFLKKFTGEEIILQEIVKDGLEIFIGIKNDPEFGSTLLVGYGGIYTEIFKDLALGVIPTSKKVIKNTLSKTKLWKILNGYRSITYDVEFLISTIYQLSLVPQYFKKIESIDVNPLILQEKSGKIVDFKIIAKPLIA